MLAAAEERENNQYMSVANVPSCREVRWKESEVTVLAAYIVARMLLYPLSRSHFVSFLMVNANLKAYKAGRASEWQSPLPSKFLEM